MLALVIGVDALMMEFEGFGAAMLIVLVLCWDVLFVMVDRLLGLPLGRRKR